MYEEIIKVLSNPEAVDDFVEEHGHRALASQYLSTCTTAEELCENYAKAIDLLNRELSYFRRKYPHPYEDELDAD